MPSRQAGSDKDAEPKRRFPRPGFLITVVVLLGLNWLLLNVLSPPEPRPTIPYSPNFLQQVDRGNVERISPIGETVTGEFKEEVDVDTDDIDEAVKNFETQIPTFANGEEL